MRLIVQLKGVDTVSLRTKKLIAAARAGIKAGVPEAAQILQLEAQSMAPVKTGALRDSITAETVEETDDRMVIAVAPHTPYARRIEYGFFGPDSLGRVYHQPPYPYMRPAWDAKKDEMRQAIADAVYEHLDAANVGRR